MKRKISVLIVDDDPQLLRLVRANLESVGYRVLVAMDATTAIELIDKEAPDLMVLDIMLPEMDGYELCRRIREFSSLPIIMLTAKVEDEDKKEGKERGMTLHPSFRWPVSTNLLNTSTVAFAVYNDRPCKDLL